MSAWIPGICTCSIKRARGSSNRGRVPERQGNGGSRRGCSCIRRGHGMARHYGTWLSAYPGTDEKMFGGDRKGRGRGNCVELICPVMTDRPNDLQDSPCHSRPPPESRGKQQSFCKRCRRLSSPYSRIDRTAIRCAMPCPQIRFGFGANSPGRFQCRKQLFFTVSRPETHLAADIYQSIKKLAKRY